MICMGGRADLDLPGRSAGNSAAFPHGRQMSMAQWGPRSYCQNLKCATRTLALGSFAAIPEIPVGDMFGNFAYIPISGRSKSAHFSDANGHFDHSGIYLRFLLLPLISFSCHAVPILSFNFLSFPFRPIRSISFSFTSSHFPFFI